MNVDSQLAKKIATGDFIVTAECAPGVTASGSTIEATLRALGNRPVVINIADNQHGIALSSMAASVTAIKLGAEPVLQMVTRDRNRIALQSDLLGAASLGIKNVLCLSGYHQTLIGCPESANVFDIDSTQFIELLTRMSEKGVLADGTKIEAGAKFIQTHAVFDLKLFGQWLEAARQAGLAKRAAILASVYPLASAAEAQKLRDTYADFCVSNEIIERLKAAGDDLAQKQQGLTLCSETIKKLKAMEGLRGVHILSGGKEALVPEILAAAGLS